MVFCIIAYFVGVGILPRGKVKVGNEHVDIYYLHTQDEKMAIFVPGS